MIRKLRKKLGPVDLYVQLMEESAELTQAASKYLRACEFLNNPTPVSAFEARFRLKEEFMDVLCVARLIFPDDEWERLIDIESYPKFERWLKRIETAEKLKKETAPKE